MRLLCSRPAEKRAGGQLLLDGRAQSGRAEMMQNRRTGALHKCEAGGVDLRYKSLMPSSGRAGRIALTS